VSEGVARTGTVAAAAMPLVEQLDIHGSRMKVRAARQLSRYLLEDFEVEYPPEVDLAAMPPGVALLPFVWNVAPIVWATDQHFVVDELDHRVATSMEAVREEFKAMYPSLAWSGSIAAKRLVEVPSRPAGRFSAASFYTGGVDSTWTALRHAAPDLLLIRVWGSDVRLENEDEWRAVAAHAQGFADTFGGGFAHVRSNFRSISYRRLDRLTPAITLWWIDVQMSLALAGLAAPLLHHHGIPLLRIASSYTAAYSAPSVLLPRVDDKVSLATARFGHDSWEYSRQAKIKAIVEFHRERKNVQWPLMVCWLSRPGRENCGRDCEKCIRTVIGLSMAGADLAAYGFANAPAPEEIPGMIEDAGLLHFSDHDVYMWSDLQQHARMTAGLEGPFWEWLREVDLEGFLHRQPPVPAKATRYAWLDRAAPRLYDRLRSAKRALRFRLQRRR
jgi:hypothetical protein